MIHKFSDIHPDAKIGKNVTIEAFTTIQKNVVIGDGTWIGPHVSILDGARIGENCKIFPGAVISAIPQDLKFKGEDTVVIIGNNVMLREYVTVNRGTIANNSTVVGDNCLLQAYVHIAHDYILGKNCIIGGSSGLAGHIRVNDFAIIGGMSGVHQFVNIGAHSMISGGSLVRKDIPPFTKGAREPMSFVGVNSIGLRRRGYSIEKIKEIHNIYRIIYLKGYNISQALDIITNEIPQTTERDEILNFIKSSTRGIMRGYCNKD